MANNTSKHKDFSIDLEILDLFLQVAESPDVDADHWMPRFDAITTDNPKRMSRYKDKISQLVYALLRHSFPNFVEGIPYNEQNLFYNTCQKIIEGKTGPLNDVTKKTIKIISPPCISLRDFCAKYIQLQLIGAQDFIDGLGISISHYIPVYFAANYLRIPESEEVILSSFFKGSSITMDDEEITFAKLFDEEFEASCNAYLAKSLMNNDDITEENFIRKLPEFGTRDSVFLFHDILSSLLPRLFFDVYVLFMQRADVINASTAETFKEIEEEKDNLKKQVSDLEKQLREKERIIKEKEEDIQSLSKRLIAEENANKNMEKEIEKKTEAIAYENKSLLRQNKKLQSYYSDLSSKYNKLKAEIGDSVADIEEDVREEMKEVDIDARYLFLLYDDIGCRQSIKEEFPNAEFTSKASSLFTQKYDMVIVLTECIDHSNYFAMKKQCKINNIPFAHCPYSNLDMIKTVIWNVLNN